MSKNCVDCSTEIEEKYSRCMKCHYKMMNTYEKENKINAKFIIGLVSFAIIVAFSLLVAVFY